MLCGGFRIGVLEWRGTRLQCGVRGRIQAVSGAGACVLRALSTGGLKPGPGPLMGFLHMVGVGPGSPGGFERIKSSSTPSLEIFGFFLLLPAFLR